MQQMKRLYKYERNLFNLQNYFLVMNSHYSYSITLEAQKIFKR